MPNPYQPPTTESAPLPASPIGDDVVARLIDGADTETLVFHDMSDRQIYGRKHSRKLTGALADAAGSAGCEPVVYLAVAWWCIAYMPVVPLGAYFVIPCVEGDDPDGDADQYRGIRTPQDSWQIGAHYLALLSLLAAVGLAVLGAQWRLR